MSLEELGSPVPSVFKLKHSKKAARQYSWFTYNSISEEKSIPESNVPPNKHLQFTDTDTHAYIPTLKYTDTKDLAHIDTHSYLPTLKYRISEEDSDEPYQPPVDVCSATHGSFFQSTIISRKTTTLSQTLALAELVGPIVLTNTLGEMIDVVQVIVVGQIGTDALAAAGLAITLYNLLWFFTSGMSTALDIFVPRAHSVGDAESVRFWTKQALIATSLGLILSSIVLLCSEQVFQDVLNQAASISHHAGTYCIYLIPGLWFQSWYMVLQKRLQGQDITVPCVYVILFANVFNVLASVLLVRWMGLIGSSIAISCSRVMLFALIAAYSHYYDSVGAPDGEHGTLSGFLKSICWWFGVGGWKIHPNPNCNTNPNPHPLLNTNPNSDTDTNPNPEPEPNSNCNTDPSSNPNSNTDAYPHPTPNPYPNPDPIPNPSVTSELILKAGRGSGSDIEQQKIVNKLETGITNANLSKISDTDEISHPSVNDYTRWEALVLFCAIAIPVGCVEAFENAVFEAAIFIVTSLGKHAVDSYVVMSTLLSLYMAVLDAFDQATCLRVCSLLMQRKVHLAILYSRVCIGVAACTVLLLVCGLFIAPLNVAKLFTSDATNQMLVAKSAVWVSCIVLIHSMSLSMEGSLTALGKQSFIAVLNMLAYWCVGIPLGWYFSRSRNVVGIWMGFFVATCMIFLSLSFMYVRLNWRQEAERITQALQHPTQQKEAITLRSLGKKDSLTSTLLKEALAEVMRTKSIY